MVQSLKSKVKNLSQAYSITAIIETAKEVQKELYDRAIWDAMSTDQKTEWFLGQCKKYNLTPEIDERSIYVKELSPGKKAYFVVFLPRDNQEWYLEIGGSYIDNINGGIWATSPGLKGKEQQIAQVIRLHNQGE
jgi:hypothetical protein